MLIQTQANEAIRAMITLRQCWFNEQDIYLTQGCEHCGSAATYLLYYTTRDIQNLMLDFIAKYNCTHAKQIDLLDLEHFEDEYDQFLSHLEAQVIAYSYAAAHSPRVCAFEEISSIFERDYAMIC